MEWDLLVTLLLLGVLAVNNYTYFVPPPPPGIEEGGGEKSMPTKNYKKKKSIKRKDKGYILEEFSTNCAKACGPLKEDLRSRGIPLRKLPY